MGSSDGFSRAARLGSERQQRSERRLPFGWYLAALAAAACIVMLSLRWRGSLPGITFSGGGRPTTMQAATSPSQSGTAAAEAAGDGPRAAWAEICRAAVRGDTTAVEARIYGPAYPWPAGMSRVEARRIVAKAKLEAAMRAAFNSPPLAGVGRLALDAGDAERASEVIAGERGEVKGSEGSEQFVNVIVNGERRWLLDVRSVYRETPGVSAETNLWIAAAVSGAAEEVALLIAEGKLKSESEAIAAARSGVVARLRSVGLLGRAGLDGSALAADPEEEPAEFFYSVELEGEATERRRENGAGLAPIAKGIVSLRSEGVSSRKEITFSRLYTSEVYSGTHIRVTLTKMSTGFLRIKLYRDGKLVASDERWEDHALLSVSD